jgi:hypothetical protein
MRHQVVSVIRAESAGGFCRFLGAMNAQHGLAVTRRQRTCSTQIESRELEGTQNDKSQKATTSPWFGPDQDDERGRSHHFDRNGDLSGHQTGDRGDPVTTDLIGVYRFGWRGSLATKMSARWYSPQLSREHVRRLYHRAKIERVPMTRLANRLMQQALDTERVAECALTSNAGTSGQHAGSVKMQI